MRHRNTGKNFGRPSAQRRALFRNLTISLMNHEQIKTTLPKAKELRRFAERIITLAKKDTLARRRLVFDRLRNRDIVTKLFNDLAPHYLTRPGGYLRVLKCGFRAGDNAPLAIVQLVDRENISKEEV